jgi:hypothetical protein
MNKRILATIGVIGLVLLLFWGSTTYAQARWTGEGGQQNWMMGNWNGQNSGPGWMGGGMMESGMMGNGMGLRSMFGNWGGLTNVDPLSIAEAQTAVTDYLADLNKEDLGLGEIMIFENHAYAQIMDTSSGKGAFEVLVDPVTRNVFPEPGPNMMWNTEYGMNDASHFGMMGSGMMGGYGYAPEVEINVSADEAVDIAQRYLEANLSGAKADTEASTFPGYYTLDFLKNDVVTGMLSVNAYTGQVFLHSWHGDFVDMVDEAH